MDKVARSDETRHGGIRRAAIDLDRRARLQDTTPVHDDDEVGHGHGFTLVVRHHDRGDPERLLEQAEFDLHVLTQFRVECRERFIQKKDGGVDRERPRNCHALALATRQFLDATASGVRQPDKLQEFLDAGGAGRAVNPPDHERIGNVLGYRKVRKQRKRLKHHAEVAPVRRKSRLVLPVDEDLPARGLLETGNEAKERGLAAPGRPEEANELACGHFQADIVDCRKTPEYLGQISDTESGQCRFPRAADRSAVAPVN